MDIFFMQYYFKSQRGVSLYLALAILTILLGIALGISAILVGELRILRDIGYSVTAFYAADSGIERELYDKHYQDPGCSPPPACVYNGFLDVDRDGTTGTGSCPDGLVDADDACYQISISSLAPLHIPSFSFF